ncbi:hypothetical protein [Phenylobacterium sp.]|uniref:hypothetical protein n=1 Tax=Phenylobacterium sp. TaxID=1871053 RepID=UPI00120A0F16|nr:hypothetical protein [Phenylobacterium sp.]THD60836.1 MAG: hypothetical protein E8A49_12720 [Phenylobacterium sp.]
MDEDSDIRDLVGAQGKLVVFLASLLQRAGVVKTGEFASLLDTFALAVTETDPEEGSILAAWSAHVRAASGH